MSPSPLTELSLNAFEWPMSPMDTSYPWSIQSWLVPVWPGYMPPYATQRIERATHRAPELHHAPPSPCSSNSSCDIPPSTPNFICANVPVIAPRPLPYHSPTFLQFDRLPDVEEDLSHPPYTRRPPKRKREEDTLEEQACAKRHAPPAPRRRMPSHRPLYVSRH